MVFFVCGTPIMDNHETGLLPCRSLSAPVTSAHLSHLQRHSLSLGPAGNGPLSTVTDLTSAAQRTLCSKDAEALNPESVGLRQDFII